MPARRCTTITLASPGPNSAITISASTKRGSVWKNSVNRISTASAIAAAPAGERAQRDADHGADQRRRDTPTISDTRVPNTVSAHMSRPRSSVPSRCPGDSGGSSASSPPAYGISCPADQRRRHRRQHHQRQPRGRNPGRDAATHSADPRVEQTMHDVGDQIGQHDGRRDQQQDRHHGRVVTAGDRVEQQPADSGPAEHRLDQRRAGEDETRD